MCNMVDPLLNYLFLIWWKTTVPTIPEVSWATQAGVYSAVRDAMGSDCEQLPQWEGSDSPIIERRINKEL